MTTYHFKAIKHLDAFIWHCMCGDTIEFQISLPYGEYKEQSLTCGSCQANVVIPQHILIEESMI